MEKLTSRQKEIIKILRNNPNQVISGQQLSYFLNVSLRTIQNEVAGIKNNNLVVSTKTGYHLTNYDSHVQIGTSLPNNDIESDKVKLLRTLLLAGEPLDIYDLADDLLLSISSLRNRIKNTEEMLQGSNLVIISQNNHVWIRGTELNKRRMIRDMIYREISPSHMSLSNYSLYFEDIDIEHLKSMIVNSVHSNGYFIQDAYLSNLFLNIVICIYRAKQGIHVVPMKKNRIDNLSVEYSIASEICRRCEEHWKIIIADSDVEYIANLFYGQLSTTSTTFQSGIINEINKFELEIRQLIDEVFEHYMLSIDYSPYLRNIALHIYELIKRAKTGNYVINDIHLNIKENCPFVYDVAVLLDSKIEQKYCVKMPDDEIGFLSVHIGLIIENAMRETDALDVLVYSSGYKDIADNIEKQLTTNYSNSIAVNTVDTFEDNMLNSNPDIIVSTMPLNIIGKTVVNISPFYNSDDHAKVNMAITNYLREKELRQVKSYLASCFNEQLFFRDKNIKTKEQAIRFLGKKMFDFGVVNENYIESVFKRESLSSTSFFNKFAIPHPIMMDAKKTMIAVLINDEGIEWDKNKVKLCLLFAVQENDSHLFSKAYSGAVKVLYDDQKYYRLVKSASLAEFINILKTTS